jgi:hypothetical protein
MSEFEQNDKTADPSTDEVENALEMARDLQEQINHYLITAQAIDDEFIRANENRNLSSETPYGEDIFRASELPDSLDQAIKLLTQIEEEKLLPIDAANAFEKATSIIKNALAAIEDCTDLPPEEE